MRSNLKHINVDGISVTAKPGAVSYEAQREAAGMAIAEDVMVVLTHNDSTYEIDPVDLMAVVKKLEKGGGRSGRLG